MSSPASTSTTSRHHRSRAADDEHVHSGSHQREQQPHDDDDDDDNAEVDESKERQKLPNCPLPSSVGTQQSPASLICSFADCSQAFSDAASLERHVKLKHQSITFRCNYPGCSAFYTLRSQLARHVSSKHVSFTHDCIFAGCSKSYQKPSQLHAHLQQKHNASAYQCSFSECGKLFLTHVGLRNHVASKHPAITFRCVSCNQVFETAAELHAHSVRFHAAPGSDDVLDAGRSPLSNDVVDEVTSTSANESSAKRSRSPASATGKRGRSPGLVLPSADGGAPSSLPSLASAQQAPLSIRSSGGVKRAYHGDLASTVGAAGTIVAAAPPSNSAGSVSERANQPAQQQHVSGPRALYSSPVPQQPLTRSSRQ